MDDETPVPPQQRAALSSELTPQRTTLGEWVWLALCTLAGGFFRASNLAARPLWSDELTTIITARRELVASFTTSQDPQPPLYQLLVRLFSGGQMPSETVLRMPACLFGIATIPAVWWCARTFMGRIGAAVATLMIALNPLLIHHSRDARPYMLFVFFTVLSITFFYRLCKSGGKINLLGYVLATVGLFLSHYYAMFIVAAQVVYAAADFLFGGPVRRRRWQVLLAFVLAGIGAAPILALFVRLLTGGMKGSWWIPPPTGFVDGFDALGDMLGLRAFGVLCVIPLIAAFWLPGVPPRLKRLFSGNRHGQAPKTTLAHGTHATHASHASHATHFWTSWWFAKERAVYLALIVGFALFVPLFGSLLVKPGWVLRYSLPVVVPMVILGLMYLRAAGPMVAVMVLVVLLGLTAPKAMKYRNGESGLRDAVAVLMQHKAERDVVILPDWTFAEDFQPPDEIGLRMYGYQGPITYVKVDDLDTFVYNTPRKVGQQRYEAIMANPDMLLPREQTWVICFMSTVKPMREFLIRRGRLFQEMPFGLYDDGRTPMYTLLRIAPR
ncbi:MAG: glycosyltransferase family 39 protein [Phycisphaeraceae bacterium]